MRNKAGNNNQTSKQQRNSGGEASGRHIEARKSLGQNFLVDRNIARKIVAALDVNRGDHVLEIGPGEGALSKLILQTPDVNLHAIEIDERAVELLGDTIPAARFPNFNVHHADALQVNWAELLSADTSQTSTDVPAGSAFKLVGNIPYYITGPLLFRTLEQAELLDRAVIMMQREVAKRIVATPRSKDYGILTIATALRGKAKLLFDVAPGCFVPRPNVRSAVVMFDFSTPPQLKSADFKRVKKLVDAAFNQRRKMLSNALERYVSSRCGIDIRNVSKGSNAYFAKVLKQRAEELTPGDYIELDKQLQTLASADNAVDQTQA